jgi:hypothetical protein
MIKKSVIRTPNCAFLLLFIHEFAQIPTDFINEKTVAIIRKSVAKKSSRNYP